MSGERLQILKMVHEGKISPEEASKLLDAVEQSPKRAGPRPTHLRIVLSDGGKVRNFSVGMGLARWALSLPGIVEFELGEGRERINREALLEAIDHAPIGRIATAAEGSKRLEIWLDE